MRKGQELNQKERFIKKIKIRIRCCMLLMLIGALGAAAGICLEQLTDLAISDWSSEYYVGTGFGLIAASTVMMIKQNRLLNNPEKLEERMRMEYDERNLYLMEKTMTYAGYLLALVLYIGVWIFGVVNVTVSHTMLYILCGYVVLIFVIHMVLRKYR